MNRQYVTITSADDARKFYKLDKKYWWQLSSSPHTPGDVFEEIGKTSSGQDHSSFMGVATNKVITVEMFNSIFLKKQNKYHDLICFFCLDSKNIGILNLVFKKFVAAAEYLVLNDSLTDELKELLTNDPDPITRRRL